MSVPRALAILSLASVVLACESHTSIGVGGSDGATVRLVNATSTPLDLVLNGAVATGNGGLAFGASSTCANVDIANGTVAVRETGTTTSIPFTSALTIGARYLVVAYPDAAGGTQLATIILNTTPTSGRSALAVFEGVPSTVAGNYDVYITAPAATLVTPAFRNLTFGFSTPFVETAAGLTQVRLTDAGTLNVVIDAGTQTLAANARYLLAIALPNPILATGC